ncbi:LytR/AlgR family response regulator transcription factor [Ideonella paludis]|uniref:Response regulator transcription factor n=1 Tax=Ideonella paludis TaxID=1233411 RepID=A0ABS5E302_9BURK|nr:LytTR family DNA-binding domain-containing protein [Ideonella paludis]MBQ0937788.1 response regulator transcription factor [Ideonella paludis]
MTSSVRVLVAEDDPVQLEALAQWVVQLKPHWSVVAQVGSVDGVRQAIDSLAPDLLILDIHLPGVDDLNWLSQLNYNAPAIFVTGDAGFAIEAFDRSAVDYLLKPVTMRRLKAALDKVDARGVAVRAPARLVVPETEQASSVRGSVDSEPGFSAAHAGWLTVAKGQDLMLVAPEEIVYLQADQKYTRVVTERGEGLVRTGITELLGRLDEKFFARVHRSVVVNIRHVAAVKRNTLGFMEVHLRGRSEVLKVSKSFQQVFRML